MHTIKITVIASAVAVGDSVRRWKVIVTVMMNVKAPWSVAPTTAIGQIGLQVLIVATPQVRNVK